MKPLSILILTLLFCANAAAQSELQQMFDTELNFAQKAAESGRRSAFLQFLSDDSVVFHPEAVNGHQFWTARETSKTERLVRKVAYADVSANGLIGYTTGSWELFPNGKPDSASEFGEFVTIWGKKPDGTYRVNVDIGIRHDQLPPQPDAQGVFPVGRRRDMNTVGWSAADASMNFLRMGMTKKGLSGAYDKFAAGDVRLLREGAPPILGKENVVSDMRNYKSVNFPEKIAMHETADMAYVWNRCEYANSNEGIEKGSCLHVWKLRNQKWWIVVGVFAPVPNEAPPALQIKQKGKRSK